MSPALAYKLVRVAAHTVYVVAEGCAQFAGPVLGVLPGSALAGCTYTPVAGGPACPVLAGAFVAAGTGTGLVHLAPAYGMDDYQLCRQHGIAPEDLLDDGGHYAAGAPAALRGEPYRSAAVLAYLQPHVVHTAALTHRVPVDWRTRQPVIQRATRQLFISTAGLAAELRAAVDGIEFHPAAGRQRLRAMLDARQEWCVSRQRCWGVPIPVLHCRATGEPVLDAAIARHAADIVEREGSDAWFARPAEDFVPAGHPLRAQAHRYAKGTDTMDVWFDSGTAWSQAARPADLCLEGGDQFRGWFQSALITAVAVTGRAPMRRIAAHGFVVDAAGAKMSKSLGNVLAPGAVTRAAGRGRGDAPLSGLKHSGVDLLRVWAASADYTKDTAVGADVLRAAGDVQQKIRNTCRFMLGNLAGFGAGAVVAPAAMWAVDRALLGRVGELAAAVRAAYEAMHYARVVQLLGAFCAEELSAFYLDLAKDRLYAETPGSLERRSCQTALFGALDALHVLMAPVLPFLAAEVHEHLHPGSPGVFRRLLPEAQPDGAHAGWTLVECRALRAAARAQLGEPARVHVRAWPAVPLAADELRELLGVSSVAIGPPGPGWADLGGVRVLAAPTRLHKCPRCWMHYAAHADSLCGRCEAALPAGLLAGPPAEQAAGGGRGPKLFAGDSGC